MRHDLTICSTTLQRVNWRVDDWLHSSHVNASHNAAVAAAAATDDDDDDDRTWWRRSTASMPAGKITTDYNRVVTAGNSVKPGFH